MVDVTCRSQLNEQQRVAEGASRQDAARIGAMNTKLTKDYNRVKVIAVELGMQVRRSWLGYTTG